MAAPNQLRARIGDGPVLDEMTFLQPLFDRLAARDTPSADCHSSP